MLRYSLFTILTIIVCSRVVAKGHHREKCKRAISRASIGYQRVHELIVQTNVPTMEHNLSDSESHLRILVSLSHPTTFTRIEDTLGGLEMLYACREEYPSMDAVKRVLLCQLPLFSDQNFASRVLNRLENHKIKQWHRDIMENANAADMVHSGKALEAAEADFWDQIPLDLFDLHNI